MGLRGGVRSLTCFALFVVPIGTAGAYGVAATGRDRIGKHILSR
jgi:hypothetical protein